MPELSTDGKVMRGAGGGIAHRLQLPLRERLSRSLNRPRRGRAGAIQEATSHVTHCLLTVNRLRKGRSSAAGDSSLGLSNNR
jgi:hypothetical protein